MDQVTFPGRCREARTLARLTHESFNSARHTLEVDGFSVGISNGFMDPSERGVRVNCVEDIFLGGFQRPCKNQFVDHLVAPWPAGVHPVLPHVPHQTTPSQTLSFRGPQWLYRSPGTGIFRLCTRFQRLSELACWPTLAISGWQ